MMQVRLRTLLVPGLFLACTGLGACTGEDAAGQGDLVLALSGGAAVRDGFPHQEGETTFAFADGWSMQFTKYAVAMGNVNLTDPSNGSSNGSWKAMAVADLKKASSASLDLTTIAGLSAVRHDLAFDLAPVSAGTENRNLDAADVQQMTDAGWSMLAEGTATHATKGTVRFRLGLPLHVQYYGCINGKDKTQGIAVEADKATGAFIYSHAIHMFWDTLATGDEDLRFDAFAAVKGDDDLVTEEELKQQDLNNLLDGSGAALKDDQGKAIYYNDNGKLPPGKQTLYHFVLEAARASAHFNGVGLCKARDLSSS